jgi:hypothetical protein
MKKDKLKSAAKWSIFMLLKTWLCKQMLSDTQPMVIIAY